jgi:pimeloyl-ACP methyl ester carboxylesterase
MRDLLLSAASVLMAGAAFAAPAQATHLPEGAAHNIVLVHGAFVDQTSWKLVADILTKKGYNVTLVENPLTSLAADVDATEQALAQQDGKTVLVGHSWAGVVITEAGNDPKVSALVYVSAFAPDVGESLASLAKGGPQTEGGAAIHPDAKGNLYIDPKVFPSAVAADLPPQIAESLAHSQLPLNHTAFEAPVDTAAWRHKPTFYVISTKDKVIAPGVQKDICCQDACPDEGGCRQPRLPRPPCEGSRRGHRRSRARGVTIGPPGPFAPGGQRLLGEYGTPRTRTRTRAVTIAVGSVRKRRAVRKLLR